jgi:hypothetical protein
MRFETDKLIEFFDTYIVLVYMWAEELRTKKADD